MSGRARFGDRTAGALLLAAWTLGACAAAVAVGVDAGLRLRQSKGNALSIRPWLTLETGAVQGGMALRHRRDEVPERPHLAAWLRVRRSAGLQVLAGAWSFEDPGGALLGTPRSQPFGAPLKVRLAARPGNAGGWRAEETGLGCLIEGARHEIGLWGSRTWRDRRADGDGFVLDMTRSERNADRLAAWRDDLALGWLRLGPAAGWEALVLLGERRAPLYGGTLAGLALAHAGRLGRTTLVLARGRHRLARLQWVRPGPGRGTLRLDGWAGRRGADPWSDPPLPLGEEPSWGAEAGWRARVDRWSLAAVLGRRWAGAAQRSGEAWERRLRLGRGWRVARVLGVDLTGDWWRMGRAAEAVEEAWSLQARLRAGRGVEITLQRRGRCGDGGAGRATGFRVEIRDEAKTGGTGGLRAQWLRFGGPRSTDLALLPWPGAGWRTSGFDGRQILGLGGWWSRGAWRLCAAVQRGWRPEPGGVSTGSWGVQLELRYRDRAP